MAIKIAISHQTSYRYDRLVNMGPHIFRLRPAPHSRTPIEAYTLKIFPEKHFINWQQDPFGNYQARVVFPEPCKEMRIDVEVIACMEVINPFDFFVEEYAEIFPFVYDEELKKELVSYLELNENGEYFKAWISAHAPKEKMRIVDFLVKLNRELNEYIGYTVRMEPGVQSCEETLKLRTGSCRDSAWLLVQVLKYFGIAARFVSGYLVQLVADVKSLDGPPGPEEDFTDLHAWAEAYIPGAGWIGLDPTSGLFAGEGHIPLCCTPHYSSAAPVTGVTDRCETEFFFSNRVKRIWEDPRVTKPYTEEQWNNILRIGDQVDQDLSAGDVRLSMGGEPTFISIDDKESPEWNTAADGPHKQQLAYELLLRLKRRFSQGGMLLFGQGKWYPGELLPRWQLSLFWRNDGYPIWKNEAWIAKPGSKPYTQEKVCFFIQELAKSLGVSPENAMPAYEDALYWSLKEGYIPANVDPLDVNLEDPAERRKLAEVLAYGLGNPVGYVLPLKWNYPNYRWASASWKFRRQHLFLIPGNSPIGFRLPLDSLLYVPANTQEQVIERSLFQELPELDFYHETIKSRYGSTVEYKAPESKVYPKGKEKKVGKEGPTSLKEKALLFPGEYIRSAVSVEIREGIMYVFLPPTDYLEHYLDLVASVEATAEKLQMPVRLEGYAPPADYRIKKMMITPDPGVIEVNIHPSFSWRELVHTMEILYDEAFQTKLGTEKFMQDGRHTGTGGGNHVTIGGRTPADSPVLRRPDLLRSLVTYWQHHPALSYLFSGAFVGPTSQAPRIDEGRDERLYEVEIAFNQIPDYGEVPFWLVDRVFRNLLIDITGNTHRTEFCIDKLYSPDSFTGRLGLLEFRAFDMPPHKQMSLLQMLLIRALISRFWKKPYKHKLIRWGTELHDKYMIPYFVYRDMQDVVNDLKGAGYGFEISWFDPFFEFRFPRFGTVMVNNIELEVRLGIEPWHVLGEETSNSGTARFVDSSVERIQVKLKGMTASRHILLCNGCRVPLRSTGVKGEFVAGIRYKAWNPPSALHPTVGVDTPLVLDIMDTWNNQIIGGCTYFVSHPGGRSYDTFPINSYEAESRRISRFWDFGHTSESASSVPVSLRNIQTPSRFIAEAKRYEYVDTPVELVNEEYPLTLDLRKSWRTIG